MGSPQEELLALHDRFCQGFAERRLDQILDTVGEVPEPVIVTSEESLLRGAHELRAFLERYVAGSTTYSWEWDQRETATFDTWGCLLAVGTETASSTEGKTATPYRMTVVAGLQVDRWVIVQVHGSSPHHP